MHTETNWLHSDPMTFTTRMGDSDPILGHMAAFRAWIKTVDSHSPESTYQGSYDVPFQRWFKFKEAFSPLLVKKLIEESPVEVRTCLDVFGGCGTTGLTALFMGVEPTIIEVNPFLADVIRAKLERYDVNEISRAYLTWKAGARQLYRAGNEIPDHFPPSFVQRKGLDRWIFARDVMRRIQAYRSALSSVRNPSARRLFRVLLGSCLVELSNAVVNGKGRRYRIGWDTNERRPSDVDSALDERIAAVIYDLTRFDARPDLSPRVLQGDARCSLDRVGAVDTVITSPPYPNSFDYTDIYNLELWTLGYIRSRISETKLRHAAVRSHVQRQLSHSSCPVVSRSLKRVRQQLDDARADLWSHQIPDMVESYFADLTHILSSLRTRVRPGGQISMIVADSAYAGIVVRVGTILGEIAEQLQYDNIQVERLRGLKSSAQQGWKPSLRESLVTMRVKERRRRAS